MFQLQPRTLYRWYRDSISHFHKDKAEGRFAAHKVYEVDTQTGEVVKEQTVHIVQPQNVGENMCIDEKMIGKNYCTIVSNHKTGKIALLIESVKPVLVKEAFRALGEEALKKIVCFSADMSPVMKKICTDMVADVKIVVDKFHVIKHVMDALNQVRLEVKNQAKQNKEPCLQNPNGWTDVELLERVRYLLYKREAELEEESLELLHFVLSKYPTLKTAYYLVDEIRSWYERKNIGKPLHTHSAQLDQWLQKVRDSSIKPLAFVVKMFNNHYEDILRYFEKGLTNAKAENLNRHIQHFISSNFGTRDKEFFFYRVQIYFAST